MSKLRIKQIGITMGDPSGIGPEIIAKALLKTNIRNLAHFKIIGDKNIFKNFYKKDYCNCRFIDCKSLSLKNWQQGKENKSSAQAALDYLNKAISLIKKNEVQALVTAPVCKSSIQLINRNFQGHTEFLAQAFKIKTVGMLFVANKMRVVVITRHIPLQQVPQKITVANILETIKLTHSALKIHFKIKNPILAVCGLNPHAGEGGRIGKEEETNIIPAIKHAMNQNIKVEGPFPSDTIFYQERRNNYDAIIAMYHDQGLIPIKTLYFNQLVNITIGLPFIRTSPAHGTAFNIAKKQIADPTSMCEAIKLAAQLIP